MNTSKAILIFSMLFLFSTAFAQEKEGIIITKQLQTTPVKNQQNTGTCWSFATTSFIETEILRMGGEEVDLSEIFFAYYGYLNKADKFLRYQGNNNFGEGGQAHDVLDVVRKYGMITEENFKGLNYGSDSHNHTELEAVLENFIIPVSKSKMPTTAWKSAYQGILSAYLGEIPQKFSYKASEYTPKSFTEKALKFNPDNYIELTSYSYQNFYQQVVLDVPDNWAHGLYYNVPLEDLMKIINFSIENGYSVDWDGDVSEEEFSHANGIAFYDRKMNVTDAIRQELFDNYQTTDDHLMHLTGLAKDKDGQIFYQTKNSWGATSNSFGGYLYMSEDYLKMQTVAILVHKEAIPSDIKKKLNIK